MSKQHRIPLRDRFLKHVGAPLPNGCIPWTGRPDRSGAGKIRLGSTGEGTTSAHRVAYEFAFGAIPAGLWVLHRCDNPACVNPEHLFLGTIADHKPLPSTPLRQRFQKLVGPVNENGCMLWTGANNVNGYGRIGYGDGRTVAAHRVAYELANGPIPDDLQVLHKCDVRSCVNPAHLFLGTQADNMQDMSRKGRGRKARISSL